VIYVGSQTRLYAFYDQTKGGALNDQTPKLNVEPK